LGKEHHGCEGVDAEVVTPTGEKDEKADVSPWRIIEGKNVCRKGDLA